MIVGILILSLIWVQIVFDRKFNRGCVIGDDIADLQSAAQQYAIDYGLKEGDKVKFFNLVASGYLSDAWSKVLYRSRKLPPELNYDVYFDKHFFDPRKPLKKVPMEYRKLYEPQVKLSDPIWDLGSE